MKNEEVELERNIDFKKLFFKILRYWYIYPVFILIALIAAFASYKTTVPLYRISVQLLISDAGEAAPRVGVGDNALPGISLGNQSHMENQLIILTSRRQIERTLRQLDFEVSYFRESIFRPQEIYNYSPFRVIIDSSEVKPTDLAFKIKFLSRDQFLLTWENGGEFSRKVNFFEKVNHPRFSFTIVPIEENIPGSNYHENTYSFTINNIRRMAGQYQSKISMRRVQFGASIVELSIMENNIQKGVDFLNKLANNSVNYTLDRKNQIALNTIDFIEKQLIGVADSLGAAENILEDFRSRNQVMDVSYQGQMIISQSQDLENQRAGILAKMDYYNYLIDYIQNNRDVKNIIAPSSMGIEDPILSQLIGQLSALNAEKSALLFNATTDNPNITRINASIENLKVSIIETIRSVIATTNLTLNDVNNRLYNLSLEIQKLPKTEQRLLNIQRTREMNNETYTFLLTKLTEAQLAKAANMPDNEIVEEAISRGKVVPNTKQYLLMILIIGLLIPSVIIFMIIFLNNKVQEVEDVKEISDLPIIGQIPLHKTLSKENKHANQANTMLAEAFRNVRTSLGYYATDKKSKTILLTSTLPSEGKSFCALNLARSFAHLNKKTILVEFDLRRPSLAKQAKISVNGHGLSSYISGKESDLGTIIFKDSSQANLHIIFAGSIPPNPAELIAKQGTIQFIEQLQEDYDIVILDTPPIGLVADAHLLVPYADVNILVVRHNTTPKPILTMNLKDEKSKNIPHLSILMNGIPFHRKEYSYNYGYNVKNKYFNSVTTSN
ncbi:GumC family protein [Alkaliflexus imshenetskii]|uniref:GumC family protein n=1 Tax=Alkaliflexus imshenetskii TaxID=286730 RepID=UPI0004788914|nr:tyrosine-protein kinase [Alkaliflexus imshenetskii]